MEKLLDLNWPILLDSGHPTEAGRYDILAAAPAIKLVTRGLITYISRGDRVETANDDPLLLLHRLLGPRGEKSDEFPFFGGALGYFGYDLGKRYEPINPHAIADLKLPMVAIGIYDWAIVTDHVAQTTHLVSPLRFSQTTEQLRMVLAKLTTETSDIIHTAKFHLQSAFQSNFTREEYGQAITRILQHIHAGDCYQVNLAQRFKAPAIGSPWAAYQRLRQANPGAYSGFMSMPFGSVASCSPECFLHVVDRQVTTKPIKGTRPRLDDSDADALQATALFNSEKDRAENLMIVDLMRNDLGRSCIPGSIKVDTLFGLEKFKNVHHLVSTISGQLRPKRHVLDLVRDCFPGGSVIGAPKISAMQLIETLEPHQRSFYCGSLGFIDYSGDAHLNIAIRSMLFTHHYVYCYGGGGIVADSDWESEYQETLDKVGGMLAVLEETS